MNHWLTHSPTPSTYRCWEMLSHLKIGTFSAILAALCLYIYLYLSQCHLRIWTQRVTLETWDSSETFDQNEKDKKIFYIVMTGQFSTLAMFYMKDIPDKKTQNRRKKKIKEEDRRRTKLVYVLWPRLTRRCRSWDCTVREHNGSTSVTSEYPWSNNHPLTMPRTKKVVWISYMGFILYPQHNADAKTIPRFLLL